MWERRGYGYLFNRKRGMRPFGVLLSAILLCQMLGCSYSQRLLHPRALAISDFRNCDPFFRSFSDHAANYLQLDPVGGKRCVAGIGANHITFGKLITKRFPASRDVWMSGYVYFPADFQLPVVSKGTNGACYGGVHLWRLHQGQGLSGSADRITMDFNVPAGLDVIQLYVYSINGKSYAKNTTFKAAKLKGHWQYWQLHINLGTPGKSNGFLRFYADRKLVDSMENQPFLPAEGDSSWSFSYADFQSNIGGCTADWPAQNGWLVRNVSVCKRHPCWGL